MISLFDADDAFADDSAMGYQRYTTDFKLACLKRYFTPPMKPARDFAAELWHPLPIFLSGSLPSMTSSSHSKAFP